MRQLYWLIIGIALSMLLVCTAKAGSLQLEPYVLFHDNSEISGGYGLQGKYVFDIGFYPYLSYDMNHLENNEIVNLASVGIGYQKTFSKRKHGLTLFIDGGYYNPHDSDYEEISYSTRQVEVKQKYKRCYQQNPIYITNVNINKTTYYGTFGAKAGLGYAYAFNPRVSCSLSGGYRYLELDREADNIKDEQDFSGWLGMLMFRIRF